VDGARAVGRGRDRTGRVRNGATAGRDEDVDVLGAHLVDEARVALRAHPFEVGCGARCHHGQIPDPLGWSTWPSPSITGAVVVISRSVARNTQLSTSSDAGDLGEVVDRREGARGAIDLPD